MLLVLNYITDFKRFWNWPKSHNDLPQNDRIRVLLILLCFSHTSSLCDVPTEIVTLIINSLGSAVKIMSYHQMEVLLQNEFQPVVDTDSMFL